MQVGERRRGKLFERGTPEAEIALTARDFSIFEDLSVCRLMTTPQLQALYGDRVDARLKALFRHGYIDRPKAGRIFRLREGGGSNPLPLALVNARRQSASAPRNDAIRVPDYTELNAELSNFSLFIPHEIDVAEVYVSFRRAVAHHPNLRLECAHELAPGQKARALSIPGRKRSLVPDLTLSMCAENAAEPSLFFVEMHRGTEPNERFAQPELQSLKSKYEGYLSYARAKRHLEQFGVSNFRVLTITTGGERNLANIAKAAGDVTGTNGVNRFLVARLDELSTLGLFSCRFVNAAGQSSFLMP